MTNDNPNDTPLKEITPNIHMNATLQTVMELISSIPEPEFQLSVLMIACSLVFKRVLFKHKIIDGPRKKIILAKAMRDFESKVRKYGWMAEESKKVILTNS